MASTPLPPAPRSSGRRRSVRARRRARWRFRLGKALFVLPNLFTSASIFCGFYAIVLTTSPLGLTSLYRASQAICLAIFFDLADGRVARLTRTQSEFGVQLDSLADVISFGVAPAVLAYRWSLASLGPLGLAVAFGYIAAGAMRLARFNVIAAREPAEAPLIAADRAPKASFFLGLPIPLAAGLLSCAVMFQQRSLPDAMLHRHVAVVMVLSLSLLMVSNLRYRTFKEVRPGKRSISAALGLLAGFSLLARWMTPAFSGLCLFCCYVLMGLCESGLRRLRRTFAGVA